tara:strand:+ start:831 stop:2714 length:1884 start_codon:yes stop_codon:yes gene_type:complete
MKIKLYILSFFLIFSCENIIDNTISEKDYIHPNTELLVRIKNTNKFKNSFKNNEYLNSLLVKKDNKVLKDVFNMLDSIESDEPLTICFYKSDKLYYNIIGKSLQLDSISNMFKFDDENIIIFSNNPKLEKNRSPEKSLYKRFEKIDQTNTNFSLSFDSINSKKVIEKIFINDTIKRFRNLYVNIDSDNKMTYINGVIDNFYSENDNSKAYKLLDDIKNSEIDFEINFDDNILTDFQAISASTVNSTNFFDFENIKSDVESFKLFQLNFGNEVGNINGIISTEKKEVKEIEDPNLFKVSFSDPIIVGPFIVKNHITQNEEIIVQDINNILYLIDSSGKIAWSKQIDEKILNKVFQVDSYKNGRLQYIFSSETQLYMLDRQGRDVGKFPLKFNDKITLPISVFDYDKNKNYRICITQGNELFMFDSKGTFVNGFKYKKQDQIITSPKHFRIQNKDLIVFKTESKFNIINRRGEIRIKLKSDIKFSSDNIYSYQNNLVSTSDNNEILKIDLKGNISKIKEDDSNRIFIVSNKDYISYLINNSIKTPKNKIDLEFGKYSDLILHENKKNIFICVYNEQSKKLYIFDEKLIPISNFPKTISSNAVTKLSKNNFYYSFLEDNNSVSLNSVSIQ